MHASIYALIMPCNAPYTIHNIMSNCNHSYNTIVTPLERIMHLNTTNHQFISIIIYCKYNNAF